MKITNLKLLATSAVAVLALAGTAHAQVAGNTSNGNNIQVGPSEAFPGSPHTTVGAPGIGASATGLTNYVAFADLQGDGATDMSGVTTINDPDVDENHQHLGLFHFAKVANNDVWFGEWTSNANTLGSDHTVYYAGTTTGTTMPAAGTNATYDVKGISNYAGNGILSGTLSATFLSGNTGTLTGSISGSSGSNSYNLNIGTAVISGVNFNGIAASATSTGALAASESGGAVSGRFYGNNAAALAGMASFSNVALNAAFGGAKH